MKLALPAIIRSVFSIGLFMAIFFSMINIAMARGYGSGDRVGENFSDYAPREKIRLFAKYDLNENGYLSLDEAAKLNISTEMFNQADTDQNGSLSRAEFSRIRMK